MTIDHLVSDPVPAIATPPGRDATNSLGMLGAVAGLGGIVASSCCVLPLVLAGLGASSAIFSGFETLVAYQAYILGAAAMLLAAAWIAFWRRARTADCASEGACAKPRTPRLTAVILALATLSVGAAAGWGIVEPVLLHAIQ